jgi:hypothetical protein
VSLGDVAGVFSRYFIVGFFLPAFFVLVGFSQTVSSAFLPAVYEDAGSGAQIAILGGTALAMGLLLLGIHYFVLRFFEGYPLAEHRSLPGVKQLHWCLLALQRRRYRRMLARCVGSPDDSVAFDAEWELDRRFPRVRDRPGDVSLLLPTSLGNAIRAFEQHSFLRWHLNAIAVWPHVEALLSEQETQLLSDTRGDVAFFINTSLLSLISVVLFACDAALDKGSPSWLVLLVPLALAWLVYRAAVGATIQWGEVVRASIDLHRLELYRKLGLRVPVDFHDERQIAWRLNATLLIASRLPDELAAAPEGPPDEDQDK